MHRLISLADFPAKSLLRIDLSAGVEPWEYLPHGLCSPILHFNLLMSSSLDLHLPILSLRQSPLRQLGSAALSIITRAEGSAFVFLWPLTLSIRTQESWSTVQSRELGGKIPTSLLLELCRR